MKLKSYLLLTSTLFAIIVVFAPFARAQTISLINPLEANDLVTLIDQIATWLLTIGLTISTLVIIWSALQFMVSGGSEKRVESARKTIWWAVVGIVVLLLAKGITLIIAGFLGGQAP